MRAVRLVLDERRLLVYTCGHGERVGAGTVVCEMCGRGGVMYHADVEGHGLAMLCGSCFQKWRLDEGADVPRNGGRPRVNTVCVECGGVAHARGLCQACYRRAMRRARKVRGER